MRYPCHKDSIADEAAQDVLELSRAVLASDDGLIAVFKVYIDESGIHDGSPVVTVAAYIARPKQWEAFTKEWVPAIRPIKVYHAADAANCQGEFKGWTPDDVAALAKRVLPIIPKHALRAVAVGIQMDDYRAALQDKPHLRQLLGEPYGACLHWALSIILRAKAQHGNREQIAFFHEQNNFSGEALRVYEESIARWQVGVNASFAFGSKQKYVPLQAADIYAYEANKRLRDRNRPNRRALDALIPDKTKAMLRYFNRENMPFLVERLESASKMSASELASWAWENGGAEPDA